MESNKLPVPAGPQDVEEWFLPTIEAMQEGFVLQNERGQIIACNTAAEAILGLTRSQMMGLTSLDSRWRAVNEDGSDCPGEQHPVVITLKTGLPLRGRILGVYKPNGEMRWLSVNSSPLQHRGETVPYGAVATFVDITDARQAQERLQTANEWLNEANAYLLALAMEDSLTGLANHRAFYERLSEEFQRNTRYGMALSLLFFDVDLFKPFNDTFGHRAGDDVLKMLGSLIRAAKREPDFAARYGGEEFAVILPETAAEGAMELAERLRKKVAEHPWPLRPITVSIGVAALNGATLSPSALVEAADSAMYMAKAQGRNRAILYESLTGVVPQDLHSRLKDREE